MASYDTTNSNSSYYQQSRMLPSILSSKSSKSSTGRFSQYEQDQTEQLPSTLEAVPSVIEFAPAYDRMRSAPPMQNHQPTMNEMTEIEAGVEYEEVPPWNTPRSIDDLHFTYSIRCESTGCRIFRVVMLMIPAGMVLLGIFNLRNCRLAPWLPYWSITVGVLWLAHCGFYFLFRKSTEKNTKGYRFLKGAFLYVCLAAFAAGTALTFGSINRINFESVKSAQHCNLYLYGSAMGITTLGYLAICVFLYFYTFTFQFSFYEPELQ